MSSRNPLTLFAGANDYRTVQIEGLPGDLETGDAWLGVFWSRDGGHSWRSTLLPGYLQDGSPEGQASLRVFVFGFRLAVANEIEASGLIVGHLVFLTPVVLPSSV